MIAALDRLVRRLLAAMLTPTPTSPRARALRAALLLGVLAAAMLAPIGLNAGWMTAVVVAFLVLVLLGAGGFAALVARVASRATAGREISLLGGRIRVDAPALAARPVKAAEGIGLVVRQTGVALPALVFFFGWALLYATLWLLDPGTCSPDPAVGCAHAFRGAGADPTFGQFVYLAINEAFANPPPDFLPASQLARTAATIEVLTGVLGVTVFAGAFFGVRDAAPAADRDVGHT
jgi:hypothetical protein